MSVDVDKSYNMLVVQTDKYAGNFERELCAYVTGYVGECGVGSNLVDSEVEEVFDPYITMHPDDHGCFRPCSIYKDDKDTFNDVAIFFNVDEDLVDFPHMKLFNERCVEFAKSRDIKILGVKIVRISPNVVTMDLNGKRLDGVKNINYGKNNG